VTSPSETTRADAGNVSESGTGTPSLLWTIFVAVLFPRLAGKRTHGRSLGTMWLTHLIGAGFALVVIVALVAYFEPPQARSIPLLVARVMDDAREALTSFRLDPAAWTAIALLATGGVEATFLFVGALFMSAGARDEPVRKSFSHALKQTWLATARIGVIVMLVGGIAVTFNELERNWYEGDPPVLPQPPERPDRRAYADDAAYQQAVDTYDQAIVEYDEAMRRYFEEYAAFRSVQSGRGSKPWYLRDWEIFAFVASFTGALWFILALICGIGAPRHVPPIERPPVCEFCGYNLTATDPDARCPECGKEVTASLAHDARPGTAWERGQTPAGGICNTAVQAAWSPAAFGRTLRVNASARPAQRYAARAIPGFVIIGMTSLFLTVASLEPAANLTEILHIVLPVTVVFGLACAIGAIVVSQLAALLVGWLQGRAVGRNLLPAAHQGSCYLAGLLILWQLVGATIGGITIRLMESGFFDRLEAATGFNEASLAVWCFVVPNFVCLALLLLQLSRMTGACKYANK